MFEWKKSAADAELTKAIGTVYSEMAGVSVDSVEHSKMTSELSKLYSLKESPKRISPDTLAIVVGNVLVAVLVVFHERAHIVTTKVPQFLLKSR